jgi:hypothetical protein
MTEDEEAALAQIPLVTADLEAARYRLLGIHASLPERSALRPVIECVLADAIAPAIRDLSAAVRTE